MRARTGIEHVRVDGLVEAHAYSLLHAVEVDGCKLLFLRNPWGNDKRWNGRWCDGDMAWAQHPNLRRRLRPEFCDDGAFWISWVDFAAIFDFVFVCARTMRSLSSAEEHARRSKTGEVPAAPMPARPLRRRRAEALPEKLPVLPAGSRVELVGRPGQVGLAGRIMEVVAWDEEKGQYELQGVPPPYWNCPTCGETNKRTRAECNVCRSQRDVVAVGTLDLPLCRARPEDVVLPSGTEVEVEGLRDFPELNGQAGTVVAFDRCSGRYHVRLTDGQVRAIRPPHIIARRAPQEEAEFGRWAAPSSNPSYVDEEDPPDEVALDADKEVRRLFDELDDELQLKKDLEGADKSWRLKRGQQLLREGDLSGYVGAELRRAGMLHSPLRLRFTRCRPSSLQRGLVGAYFEAVLQFDSTITAMHVAESSRQRMSPGCFLFVSMASPGWTGEPVMSGKEKAKVAGASWGGWVCPDCGHINNLAKNYCASCEDDEFED